MVPSIYNTPTKLKACLTIGGRNLAISAHVVPESLVIQKALDLTYSTDGNVLIPESSSGKVHDILFVDFSYYSLNLFGAHPSARGDDLPANVFCNGCGAVEG
jgi:hypothetical protein